MSNRDSLIRSITDYHTAYPEEHLFKKQFVELLENPRAFFRDHLPAHITASSWIVDRGRQHALLTHHAKLGKWLQPGGHADAQEDVLAVSQREAYEETGLTSLTPLSTAIFDLDIHPIPERAGFPAHLHYDIFEARIEEAFTISNESHDLAWIPFEEIGHKTGQNYSILRMIEKARRLP
jgi:8-oxo-dGTP pyrophosphatase MutT (NUDIX family)